MHRVRARDQIVSNQLEMFGPKLVKREGHEYARPEPQNLRERCIDGCLLSTEDQWVLRNLLAGKTWAEAAGNSHVGQYGDTRWQADPKGLEYWENDGWSRIMPSEIMARAKQFLKI